MQTRIMSQFVRASAIAIALLVATTSEPLFAQDAVRAALDADLPLGLVKERPTTGPVVKVDSGFMVSYVATIPGTDVGFTMIPIVGGKFTMGSPTNENGRHEDEGPQFEVTVEPFWMGKYEVTWAEYKQYMGLSLAFKRLQKRGLRRVNSENEIDAVTAPSSLYDPSYTFAEGQGNDQPAATMTQFAAKQYTKWLSLISEDFYRLPTEAEWEYACRAGTNTAYYFGNDSSNLKEYAWFGSNAGEERHAVGKLIPNPWGLHDMYGNVAEWVLDRYDKDGYRHVEAGSTVTSQQAFRQPTQTYPRVVRGGSFELERENCRSASRLGSNKDWGMGDPCYPKSPWWYTTSPASGVGFRLLRPLTVPVTREERNAFWSEDHDAMEVARFSNESNGRGAYGPVDPDLPSDIFKIKDADK